MNLNQVTMACDDIDRARAFYQTLGFEIIVDTPHYLRFVCPHGDASFSLSLKGDGAKSTTTVYFEHDDLDQWVDTLVKKGIEFSHMPTDQRWLWREAELFDPCGNRLILYYAGENRLNPPWRALSLP